MRNLFLLIVAFFIINGCSAQWHLKRAIAKGANVYVQKWDTTFVTKERVLTDTVEILKDTTIIQDGVIVKLQYVDRYIYVSAKCVPDTISVTKYIRQKVSVPEKKKNYSFLWELSFAALIIFLTAMFFNSLDKRN